jgi:hypothetical protein
MDDDPDAAFYADDGRIGGADAAEVQKSLDVFTDLFARMGLVMNAKKTVAMSMRFEERTGGIHSGSTRERIGAR